MCHIKFDEIMNDETTKMRTLKKKMFTEIKKFSKKII